MLFGLVSAQCEETFFVRHDFFDKPCLLLLVSRLLSAVIVLGSMVQRLPQIRKIYPSGDVTGLSVTMFMLDALCYTITTAYNARLGFPVLTYAENLFLLAQTGAIVVLIAVYSKSLASPPMLASFAAYVAICAAMFGGALDGAPMMTLQGATIPIFIVGRVPQIVANFRNGHTGQLALVSVAMGFLGSIARIFTALQEAPDPMVLGGFATGVVLNGLLLTQIVAYWKATNAQLAKLKAKKAK